MSPIDQREKHLLVVDDDVELAAMYQELLEARDYRTTTAANGLQALKVVMNFDVDAILCDLSMPELRGDHFYIAVGRVRPQLLNRFIFVTANANNPLYEKFLKGIRAPVLAKPVSLDQLLETLETVLTACASSSKSFCNSHRS